MHLVYYGCHPDSERVWIPIREKGASAAGEEVWRHVNWQICEADCGGEPVSFPTLDL